MALIYCRECGKQFSDQAAACPNCGAPNARPLSAATSDVAPKGESTATGQPKRKGIGIGTWLVIGIAVFVLVMMIASAFQADEAAQKAANDVAQKAAAERQRIAALTPEQRAAETRKREEQDKATRAAQQKAVAEKKRQDEVKSKRSEQIANAGNALVALRQAMKSPEAFELKSLIVKDSGAACYDYRAINSFGAKLKGNAVMIPSGRMYVHEGDDSGFVAAWNKYCTKSGGEDVTDLVRRALRSAGEQL